MAAKSKDQMETELKKVNELSAKGMAQLREEKNKKDLDDYIAEKRKEEQMKYSKWLDELRNKHKKINERTGKETTYDEELKELADAVINSEQNAYNDWRSNMMSLLNLFGKMNKAVSISADQVAGEAWNRLKNPDLENSWAATQGIGYLINKAGDGYTGVKAKMLHAIKGEGELQLPTLEHKVTFKDGKVMVANLTYNQGVQINSPQKQGEPAKPENQANQAFRSMVALWLAENDYLPVDGKEGEYKHYASGAVLDEDTFKRLNADPETSLSKFLKDNANLKYEEQQESRATPTPP
ncbi:hypothetical protein DGG96_12570 [Legionella qingyii]|uniref:Membrane-associated HD superfamily hydrolase n=1 Tax=Legionella qingyii TaxID=2184757 RepID=A0A317U237_9GAMM|nr:hypothetical protein [Legionella qingyii]PWY55295.1 hypothetical protein DGG96_12570 [Legionella qingyii]RUR22784.1 hypothetical protein ELY20_08670 [Legionella qingyii]RUR23853.1 hypothetical protein ELY16_12700 [Legionella qingyii]